MAGRQSLYETHIKPYFEQIDKWLNGGASEKQCAEKLGVCYASWNNYKNKYAEFKELCEKPRVDLVGDLRSALCKRALGFEYEEKKQYITQEVDPVTKQPVGKPVMRTEIYTRQALPDVTAIFGALNIYDDEYCKDKKQYELKQQELELRRLSVEADKW